MRRSDAQAARATFNHNFYEIQEATDDLAERAILIALRAHQHTNVGIDVRSYRLDLGVTRVRQTWVYQADHILREMGLIVREIERLHVRCDVQNHRPRSQSDCWIEPQ